MKKLIAEDEPASRLYLKDTLESHGYTTKVAENGLQALRSRANNYLKKPIRHSEMLPLVEKYASIVQSYNLT